MVIGTLPPDLGWQSGAQTGAIQENHRRGHRD
jgi:hypothetical protein